ncbi:MAG: adenylate kinase [Candidatus Eisenbacteria bacterium]
MRLVLLGPPGVGKGTQGRRLARERGWPLISTGEMLREAVARKTELGLKAATQMDAGFLVGDDVMIGLVRERTTGSDVARGFVLDGFPRTVPQAQALDGTLAERSTPLEGALFLTLPEEDLVQRMSGRRECPVCKRAYNVLTAPSRNGIHCDDHPESPLRMRPDDAPDTVRRRIGVYREQTEPLVGYYRLQRKLAEVNGAGSMDEVQTALRRAVHGLEAGN